MGFSGGETGAVALDEITARAARVGALYCERFGIVPDEAFFLGKLAEELGEVSAATLKLTGGSRGGETPMAEREANLREEMADLLGFLLMFAAHRGIDLDAAFDEKWGRWLKD
ncbi:MAG: MazG nucleotide pyrophosphohydrolase domain-containing protein [Paracoccaceae bacterium]